MNILALKSVFFCVFTPLLLLLTLGGCDEESSCSVHSQCGLGFLCRSSECVPKCDTYLTCGDGEVCVMDENGEGACEVPTADYCSVIAPMSVPEMGVYMPCPPEADAGMGGAMEMNNTTAGGSTMGGATTGGATTGGATTGGATMGGTPTGGTTTGGMTTGGMTTGGMTTGGMTTGGTTLELVGGTPEEAQP